MQLAVMGVFLGMIAMIGGDGADVWERGLFAGWTSAVWGVVLLQTAGGLLVAMVVQPPNQV